MAQFSVYRNKNASSNKIIPYLLSVQSELLDGINTRVVIPLAKASAARGMAAKHLNPIFTIEDVTVVMLTQEMAGINQKILGQEVGNLKSKRKEIIEALDFLFTGI